jgi:hypothetical protein
MNVTVRFFSTFSCFLAFHCFLSLAFTPVNLSITRRSQNAALQMSAAPDAPTAFGSRRLFGLVAASAFLPFINVDKSSAQTSDSIGKSSHPAGNGVCMVVSHSNLVFVFA